MSIDVMECRNCCFLYPLEKLNAVHPGHRFCTKCYNKMLEIGQIVYCNQRRDGTMVMLWQGDPYRIRNRDPFQKMFQPGKGPPLVPPSARDT